MIKSGPVRVSAAVVIRRGTGDAPGWILISHRFPDAHLPDYWEFPGGKVESRETGADCARREVLEETGVEVRILGLLARQTHAYPDRLVEIEFHACEYDSGIPAAVQCQAVRWVALDHLEVYSFPNANQEVVERLGDRDWITPPRATPPSGPVRD